MSLQRRGWLLVLILSIFSSNLRNTVSGDLVDCISLITANSQFSASSSLMGPGHAKIRGNDVWCAAVPNHNQYLTVDLGFNLMFDRVAVQGLPNSNRSVTEYRISYSVDNQVYTNINNQLFWGNYFNGNTVRKTDLNSAVQARYVRFHPREPVSVNENYFCMRVDVQSCHNDPDPIHGMWTQWSAWSPCSPCGGRLKTRSRTCTNPSPAFGGLDCSGVDTMTQFCPDNCNVDGQWSEWSVWAICSATCGQGQTFRTRECNNPPPAGSGASCSGRPIEVGSCSNGDCPVTTTALPPTTQPAPTSEAATTAAPTTEASTTAAPTTAAPTTAAPTTAAPTTLAPTTEAPTTAAPTTAAPTTVAPTTEAPTTAAPTTAAPSTLAPSTVSPSTVAPTTAAPTPAASTSEATTAAASTTSAPTTLPVSPTPTTTTASSTSPSPTPGIPDIDLTFAISATSANSNTSYEFMKNTIKQFIDKYGVNKIHYSIYTYGDSVVRVVSFNSSFPPSANELKAAIDAQPPLSGGPVLEDALHEAFRIYNETEGRPGAKKVLVVVTDNNSGTDRKTLSDAVKTVEDKGVLVLAVGVGSVVDRNELEVISPNPLDVISTNVNEIPEVVTDRVMDRILRRTIPDIDVGFAIRDSEIDSVSLFTLMLETIETINDRYRPDRVKYSVIVYGNVNPTTSLDFDNVNINHNDLIDTVNQLVQIPGPVDLQEKLTDAEALFRSHGRQNAKKVFIVLTDVSGSGNDSAITTAGASLIGKGILVFAVNRSQDGTNVVTVTQIDYLGIPTFTTDRSVVIAETIIRKAMAVNIPLIDLTFALSATSVSSDITIITMREAVNSIIDQYGIDRIHYSVIPFGSVVTTLVDFSDVFPDKNHLVRMLARLQKNTGGPNLLGALEEAKRLYEFQEVRANARKVLVVILDSPSASNSTEVRRVVTELNNNEILVIGVGLGSSANPNDLVIITQDDQHVINAGDNTSPNELAEQIIDAIFIAVRTAGFSQWGAWSACSKSCRSGGVSGTQLRSRICERPRRGCIGPTVETRECNTENCQGCGERGPFDDQAYQASSAIQPASWARLNTSEPSASLRAWCADPDVAESYVQIDLGELVQVSGLATKGQELTGAERWVTSYSISYSEDGLSFETYREGGQTKNFTGNTDPNNVAFKDVNITTAVRFVRFHPITFVEQPCMQASVFGCISQVIGPSDPGALTNEKAEIGVLIALWILAGILSFLLLMACCYYCCWHVCCCRRGKKRKGLTAFTHTWMDDPDGYLIEDLEKRWRLPSADIVTTVKAVPEDEIQEVIVEMRDENAKPSGIIQFGIETEETIETPVTAETVHTETPMYSEDVVGTVKSGASMITLSSDTARYASIERRNRVKSDSSGAGLNLGAASLERYNRNQRRKSSGVTNEGFTRSKEWLLDSKDSPQARPLAPELRRSQSADELAVVDYDMFAQPRGPAHNAVRGELGRDGYMRMRQTNRDAADGEFPMGTADVAIGGIEAPDARRGSSQLFGLEGQEITFMTDNGGYRREQWSIVEEVGPEQLREERFREVLMEEDPPYAEIHFDDEGNILHVK